MKTRAENTWQSCQASLIDPDCVCLSLLSLCSETLEKILFLRSVLGARGIVGFREAWFLSVDRSGNPISEQPKPKEGSEEIDRGAEVPLTLFESSVLFCSVFACVINHALLTCLLTDVIVLSTHMNYGCGNYTKTDRKQTQK